MQLGGTAGSHRYDPGDMNRLLLCSTLLLSSVCAPSQDPGTRASAPTSRDWSNFRGPEGTGVAPDSNPPTQWSEEKNIRWKVQVPGFSHASPIVLGDRIYLMTAIDTGKEAESTALEAYDARSKPLPTSIHQYRILALERRNGDVAWDTLVKEVVPHEGGHRSNSLVSSSPVTDGEHIYANFGSHGLYCLSLDGEIEWSVDLGKMRTRYQYGEGSSPTVHGDRLIVNCDQEGDSFIATFNKHTGEELWRRSRDEATTWGTPIVATVEGRPQIVINGFRASRGYDLQEGELLWTLPGLTELCIPTPIHAGGVVYLMTGYPESALQVVRLAGSKGDLTDSENVLWSHSRNASYVSSPVLYGNHLYFIRLVNGVLSCLDARTGEVQYEGQRLGVRTVISSLVAASDRLYVTSQAGVTKVIKVGPSFEELASNELEDTFNSSPAIAGDEIYLRGGEFLYCIAELSNQ